MSRHAKIGGVGWAQGKCPPLVSSRLIFMFALSAFLIQRTRLSQKMEQANSDVMDGLMTEKMNEVLKSYTLLYLKIKVKFSAILPWY